MALPTLGLLLPKRSYAVAARKDRLVFSEQDVPPLQFWEATVTRQRLQSLSGYDCFEAAMTYCSLAMTGAGSTWKGRLLRGSNYTLHCIGTMLLSAPPGPAWRLGLHVLATASDLEYSPSTLSLVMLLLKTSPERLNKTIEQQMFRNAQMRFRRLVVQAEDPDAFTLNGLILANQGNDVSALQYLRKAVKSYEKNGAGSFSSAETLEPESTAENPAQEDAKGLAKRAFRWNWEASCYTEMGRILARQGDPKAAEEAFRVAADELDTADAYFELAKLQPAGSSERERYLVTASASGNKTACRDLAASELDRARVAGLTSKQAEDHRRAAREWLSIAGEEQRAGDTRTVQPMQELRL
ncbi:hypothetical protein GQ53DRAFT_673926 [Thozetella sp. PMI_491]|nr:hypothetical protein GQ53DRAFT_673926 [Thozetella sp. PMI_491]